MKKLYLLMAVLCGGAVARGEKIILDIHSQNGSVYQAELEPGIPITLERSDSGEPIIKVHSGDTLGRVSKSVLKTLRSHPFFTALAVWALGFSRESIIDHPIVSAWIAADLLSEFSFHMLHDDQQSIVFE